MERSGRPFSSEVLTRRAYLVLGAAFLWLSFLASEPRIGAGYIDPVGRITAQDEALYSHTSLHMARHGDWLTPRFLDRYALYKPPLLYWLAGGSAKLLGPSPFALRLVSIVAGAGTVALVYVIASQFWGVTGGMGAAVLLASSRLFYSLSRRSLTDALLCFLIAGSMFLLLRDPTLSRRRTALLYGIALGLALMLKGIAGLIPALLLAAWVLWTRYLPWRALLTVAILALAVATPWHAYQYTVHQRWFWTEYVELEILRYGLGAPPQTSSESWPEFYGVRLWLLDPVLLIAAAASIPLLTKLRFAARAIAVWMSVILIALASYRYRNASYLLPLFPALAVASGALVSRYPKLLPIAAMLVVVKLSFPGHPWGLAPTEGVNAPAALALDRYARMGRPQELILVFSDDDFYAATLTLPKIRYALWTPEGKLGSYQFPFEDAGIATTVAGFLRRTSAPPMKWGLDNTAALATAILVQDEGDLRRLVEASPQHDFYVETRFIRGITTHDAVEAKEGWTLLLSRRDSPV